MKQGKMIILGIVEEFKEGKKIKNHNFGIG